MRYRLLLSVLCLGPGRISAQARWQLTFEAGITTFSAAAHDTSTDRIYIRPWRPTSYTLRLLRNGERLGAGLGLTYIPSSLGVNTADFSFSSSGELQVLEIVPELRYRIGATAPGVELLAHAGPVFEIWAVKGADPRGRIGGLAGATLAFPLAASWRIDLRGDLAMTPSYLNRDEDTAEIHRERSMRRGRVALGLTRRL
jgi:hypothetical protein